MVTLFCAVVGVAGSAFPVDVDDEQSVGHMKDAINDKKKYRFPADELQLFLAKTKRGGWLPDDDPAALKLKVGAIHPDIQTMIDVEQLGATWEIQDVLAVNKMTEQHGRTPTSRQIHVLVVVPLEWHDPAAKYSLLEEEVVPRGTGGSPLLQLADQDVLWYGMKGSVGRGEGIDLRDERTLFRSALTADIIDRLEETYVVLVKSPPMTGKTSLATLMSRALVHRHEENKKKAVVFNFSALGMSREGKTFDQIFVEYCKVEWEYATVTLPASHCMVYLVLDETQLIYEEDSSPIHKSTCFWELVKRVQTDAGFQVRIVMFAAYGSDVVYSRLATPTKFNDEMVFGIKELNFSHAEVIEYVTKWFEGRSSLEGSPSMMEAFCANLEVLTGGHVGLCASAVSALNQVFQSRRKSASDFPSADEWISMLQTGAMYKPNDAELFKDLIETRAVKVLETLSVEKLDRLERTSFGANQDVAIVDECLRKGILAQRKHKIEFSSPVMWRYFVRLRVGHIERADYAPVTLPEMNVRVLSTVDYSSIRETLGRSFLSGIPLERTLQMEFYKAAYRCTPQNFVTSADVGVLFGPPGFIDFTIQGNDGFWGVELTREDNNLAEHIERFSAGGLYSLLGLTDFCLIDFRCVGSIDELVMERIAADMGLCGKLFVMCYDARMTGVKVFNSVMKIVYQVDFR